MYVLCIFSIIDSLAKPNRWILLGNSDVSWSEKLFNWWVVAKPCYALTILYVLKKLF